MPHYIMDVYNIIVDRYVHTYNAMVSMMNAQCTIEAYKEHQDLPTAMQSVAHNNNIL